VKRQASLPFILITIVIDMMGVGVVLPVLPALVGAFTPNVEAQAHWYGALTFTFSFTQFFCAPLLGALSDRFGRRRVLLLSIAGLGTMYFLSGIVTSLPALLAARILGGALASNIAVANAYVADITTAENRAESFGMVGGASGVGFILGPLIGGLLGDLGVRYPFFFTAGLALLNFAYGLFVLPESLPPERRRPIDLGRANPFGALLGLVRLQGVGVLVTVIALVSLGRFILQGTWILFNTLRFGWGTVENGALFFVIGLMSAIVQGGLLGRLLRALGERGLVLAGLASGTVAYVGYGLAPYGWMMYAILLVNILAFGVGATLNAMVSRAAAPHEQGLAMGSVSSLNSLVAVFSPLLGTLLFARVSGLPKNDIRVGASFFLSATSNLVALALMLWHFAREREPTGQGRPEA
jgi:DHA1 family tetracycline resistance protein-like MFS transporter